MRKEGEEKLRSLGSGLTKVKKNFHKKRAAAMIRNKTDFTGKRSAVGDSRNHLTNISGLINLGSTLYRTLHTAFCNSRSQRSGHGPGDHRAAGRGGVRDIRDDGPCPNVRQRRSKAEQVAVRGGPRVGGSLELLVGR